MNKTCGPQQQKIILISNLNNNLKLQQHNQFKHSKYLKKKHQHIHFILLLMLMIRNIKQCFLKANEICK